MRARKRKAVRKLARQRPSVDGLVLTSDEYELALAMAAALPGWRTNLDWNRYAIRFMESIRGAFVILPVFYKLDEYPKALPSALGPKFQSSCLDRSITKHPKWKSWIEFAERVFDHLDGSLVVLTQKTYNQWSIDVRRRVGSIP